MFLGFHDNFRLAVLINFVLIKKKESVITLAAWRISLVWEPRPEMLVLRAEIFFAIPFTLLKTSWFAISIFSDTSPRNPCKLSTASVLSSQRVLREDSVFPILEISPSTGSIHLRVWMSCFYKNYLKSILGYISRNIHVDTFYQVILKFAETLVKHFGHGVRVLGGQAVGL